LAVDSSRPTALRKRRNIPNMPYVFAPCRAGDSTPDSANLFLRKPSGPGESIDDGNVEVVFLI
jgi:hypothetical protein